MRQFRTLFLFVAIPLLSGCASSSEIKLDPNAKVAVRAAFDIGSGSTKMKVGRVTTSGSTVAVELLFPVPSDNGERKVTYMDALKASGKNNVLSDAVIEMGITELKNLKALAEPLGATEYLGVATAAFREAQNGKEALEKIGKATGIALRVVSQEEEASLGFWGAVGVAKTDPAKTVVWDIGGGSQQISHLDASGGITGANNRFGSDILKERVRAIQKRKKGVSVNPVGKSAVSKGLALIRKEAKIAAPLVKTKVTDPETRVLGIGGVHAISLKDQAMAPEDKYYDQGMVKRALEASWNLTDEKVGTKYVENQVPNLMLVLGFMEELGITEVTPLKVNLADGLLRVSGAGKTNDQTIATPATK